MEANTISLTEFEEMYVENLKKGVCYPDAFGDLCGGWTVETFKQVIAKMTKNGRQPIPLYYEATSEMRSISNKRDILENIFKIFNTRPFIGK